ncbi:peptidylprolyl isomerase [Thalassotalea agarivorans]|uniref:peptidylprolyl isomerase n=1 Tax=Thalassotalea agarivorans TaxID=349064 RepID=A0A1I0E905_THASX|nr:peptidylprolyl isomerase [Thalassotalea agarivorans]SET41672.1 peptidylprolyl isomerase [Thalassotalea agarivorans]
MKLTLVLLTLLTFSSQSAESESLWRTPDKENTLLLNLANGLVVIELAPEFAPNHVAHIKSLVRAGFYHQSKFYRVVDGFVAQAGPLEDPTESKTIAMEDSIKIDKQWPYTSVSKTDMFAAETGFKDGFAVALDADKSSAWLTHCPGTIALARETDKDSGTHHFYFVIGQAPRYLDRNMAIFGRVIYGMDNVQGIARTKDYKGDDIIAEKGFTDIVSFDVMADLPQKKQLTIEVERTDTDAFAKRLFNRANRTHPFFYHTPPAVLDVCQVQVHSRVAPVSK